MNILVATDSDFGITGLNNDLRARALASRRLGVDLNRAFFFNSRREASYVYKIHRRDLTFNLLNVAEVSRQSFVWALCALSASERAFVTRARTTRPSKLASSITVQWLTQPGEQLFRATPVGSQVQVSYWLFTIGPGSVRAAQLS